MFANYHTHTARCHHASGSDREYVEAAIKAGFHVLGFSDHVPYVIDNYTYKFRMRPEETEGYINSIHALKEEYKKDIKILIGFEAEYYPTYFERTLDFINGFDYDYLILGQHHIDDGAEKGHLMHADNGDDVLVKYVDVVIEAIKTGKFTYIAHPDVINYNGDDDFYKEQMTRLCRAAKELSVPLELNCLGAARERCYPSERFFKIAGKVGNSVVLGVDAHSPDFLLDSSAVKKCEELMRKCDLFPLREVKIRNPKI